jgi:hypothetical protein
METKSGCLQPAMEKNNLYLHDFAGRMGGWRSG